MTVLTKPQLPWKPCCTLDVAMFIVPVSMTILDLQVLSDDAKSSPVGSPSSMLPSVPFAAQQQHSSVNTSPPVISEHVHVMHEETPLALSIR